MRPQTCYSYVQNLPIIVMILPRTYLAVLLSLSSFSLENLLGGLSPSGVGQSIARRDETYFNMNAGALSTDAKLQCGLGG